MVHGGRRIGAALVALLVTTGGAATGLAAPDEEVLDELRQLRDRVEDLEAWKADRQARDAAPSNLSAAIEQYLGTRSVEGPSGGIVVAPRSKKIEIGGMIRARAEMRRRTPQGPDFEGRHHNEWVYGRARLHAKAHIEDDLVALVEIQDARIWGEDGATAADSSGVGLSQGYVDFLNVFGCETDVRIGRQKVAFSDQRFIGHLEWSNPGRRFDGVTVDHDWGDTNHKLFWYRTAEGFPVDDDDDDQDVLGFWSTFPDVFGERTAFEAFSIYVNDNRDLGAAAEVNTGFVTTGLRAHGKPAGQGWDWDTQVAVQTGEVRDLDQSAWAARGEIGYRFDDGPGAPRLGFEVDWATGDEDVADNESEQFLVLFPTNHGYYGIHDLAAWSNQRAWSFNFSTGLGENWSMKAAYWRFNVDEEDGGWVNAGGGLVRLPTSSSERSLGHEFDITFKYQQSARVTWEAGWAHFWAGSYARNASPDVNHDSDWFYLQTVVTF